VRQSRQSCKSEDGGWFGGCCSTTCSLTGGFVCPNLGPLAPTWRLLDAPNWRLLRTGSSASRWTAYDDTNIAPFDNGLRIYERGAPRRTAYADTNAPLDGRLTVARTERKSIRASATQGSVTCNKTWLSLVGNKLSTIVGARIEGPDTTGEKGEKAWHFAQAQIAVQPSNRCIFD